MSGYSLPMAARAGVGGRCEASLLVCLLNRDKNGELSGNGECVEYGFPFLNISDGCVGSYIRDSGLGTTHACTSTCFSEVTSLGLGP